MSISLILLLVVTLVRLAIFAFVIYAAVQGGLRGGVGYERRII